MAFSERPHACGKPLIVVLCEETINQGKSDGSALDLELCMLESLGLELSVGCAGRRRKQSRALLISVQVIY